MRWKPSSSHRLMDRKEFAFLTCNDRPVVNRELEELKNSNPKMMQERRCGEEIRKHLCDKALAWLSLV
jgi:hypothetical protein